MDLQALIKDMEDLKLRVKFNKIHVDDDNSLCDFIEDDEEYDATGKFLI